MSLQLKKFDMSKIKYSVDASGNKISLLIGRRDTGASFIVRDLEYYDKNNNNNK